MFRSVSGSRPLCPPHACLSWWPEMTRSPFGPQGFYEEVANPLLTGVEVEYPENAILDLTQNTYKHFYDGSEIVVAGRLVDEDMNNFKADVKGHGVSWASPSCVLGEGDRHRQCSGRLADGPAVAAPELGPPGSRPAALKPLTFSHPAQAINDLTFTEEVDMKEMEQALQERDYIFGNYIERLWAYLTIEQLLERR